MKIKTVILLILIAIIITACINRNVANESKTEAPTTQETAGQQQITKIEPQNETVPPGTIVQKTTSQIKFHIIPPSGNNESIPI